jgi:hypothetical protein
MPISKAGKKIKSNLEKQYGKKKGEQVFYAMENKGEIPGMKKMKKGYAVGGEVPSANTTRRPRRNKESDMKGSNLQKQAQREAEKAMRNAEREAKRANRYAEKNREKREERAKPAESGMPILKRAPAPTVETKPRRANTAMEKMEAARNRRRQIRAAAADPNVSAPRVLTPAQKKQRARAERQAQINARRGRPMPTTNRTSRPFGMAKGGLTKSTGTLNTGIKKAGK